MLNVIQYLSIIAAFAIPWLVGTIIKSAKSGDKRKVTICAAICVGCLIIIGLTVWIAFAINGGNTGWQA